MLPYYRVDNSFFRPCISQHFGLEIDPEDTIPFVNDLGELSRIRCPAGYVRRWETIANQNDSGSKLAFSGSNFEVQLDVQHFNPEEVSVKIENGVIVVEGQHEEKADGQGFVSRHFIRKYNIPENSDTAAIQSTLSTDGILTITVPGRVQQQRVIPIQFANPHADAA